MTVPNRSPSLSRNCGADTGMPLAELVIGRGQSPACQVTPRQRTQAFQPQPFSHACMQAIPIPRFLPLVARRTAEAKRQIWDHAVEGLGGVVELTWGLMAETPFHFPHFPARKARLCASPGGLGWPPATCQVAEGGFWAQRATFRGDNPPAQTRSRSDLPMESCTR